MDILQIFIKILSKIRVKTSVKLDFGRDRDLIKSSILATAGPGTGITVDP